MDKNIEWKGKGIEEKGIDRNSGRILIDVDPQFFRSAEVNELVGDASKAQEKLGWKPRTNYNELIQIMVRSDLARKGLNPEKIIVPSNAQV